MLKVPQRPIDTIRPHIRSLLCRTPHEASLHKFCEEQLEREVSNSLKCWPGVAEASDSLSVPGGPTHPPRAVKGVVDLTVTWHLFLLCLRTYKCSLGFSPVKYFMANQCMFYCAIAFISFYTFHTGPNVTNSHKLSVL